MKIGGGSLTRRRAKMSYGSPIGNQGYPGPTNDDEGSGGGSSYSSTPSLSIGDKLRLLIPIAGLCLVVLSFSFGSNPLSLIPFFAGLFLIWLWWRRWAL